ncbi:MAG TPA: DUF4400 domain-containing protein [Cellvibrio sp.]|nr:DUF4400 domain-containing protein [Cellvibrio sp.]
MTEQRTAASKPVKRHKKGVWEWLADTTIGNALRFAWWALVAMAISVLVEWIGMIWIWGPEHSKEMLHEEIGYLGTFSKNLITGIYPVDIGLHLVDWANIAVNFLHLRGISDWLAKGFLGSATTIAVYGIESMINTIFIFAVRSAICVSALSGFVLVALVAFIDGLVERDIRKACGGIESAMMYHHAKRLIVPSLFLTFGGYLTAPISIHPTLIFLPVMGVFAMTIYVTAKSFKKFI